MNIREMNKVQAPLNSLLESVAEEVHKTELQESDEEIQQLVDALEMMYDQYCQNGHDFMTAGENAEVVLQKYGFDTDAAGRITHRPIRSTPLV